MARRVGTRWLGAVGALALLGAAGAWAAGKKSVPKAGGVMAEASVTRLEGGEVGVLKESQLMRTFVDPSPIVLWSGSNPAAVLLLREETTALGVGRQSFAPAGGPGGPFPLEASFHAVEKVWTDTYHLGSVFTADLTGEGTEQLVLVRQSGTVEVHGPKKTLFRHELPASRKFVYSPVSHHRARAGGRDVLFLVFRRMVQGKADPIALAKADAGERSLVLRLDAGGIARMKLGAVAAGDVLGVGAVARASSQLDELLVVSAQDGDAHLSRHRLDGTAIDAPRKIYLPFPGSSEVRFSFLAGSSQAVASVDGKAYFFEAEKPANWIRAVAPAPRLAEGGASLLGAIDPAAPKALLLGSAGVLAVDREGTYFGPGLAPSKEPVPFLRLEAEKGEGLFVLPGEGGELLLAVRTHAAGTRTPPLDEVMAAAERFLAPYEIAELRERTDPTLDGVDSKRDRHIDEEMQARGITERPATKAEWKARLPSSWQTMAEYQRPHVVFRAVDLLLDAAAKEGAAPALVTYAAGLKIAAGTRLELYRRGARVAAGEVAGYLDPGAERELARPRVEFRAGPGGGALAILSLVPTGAEPGQRGQLFAVRLGAVP